MIEEEDNLELGESEASARYIPLSFAWIITIIAISTSLFHVGFWVHPF